MPEDNVNLLRQLAEEALREGTSGQVGDESDPVKEAITPPKEEPSKSTQLRDYLKSQYGYDLGDDVTDDQLLPQVGKVISNYQAMEEELKKRAQKEEYGNKAVQDYLRNAEQFHQWRQAQEAESKSKPEGDKPKEGRKWNPIKYNPEWEKRVKWDEKANRFVPATEFDSPLVADEANRWYQYQNEISKRIASDPWGLALEAGGEEHLNKLREEFKQEIEQTRQAIVHEIEGRTRAAQAEQQIASFFEANMDEYFNVDDKGQVKIDPVTRSYSLTPKGQAYLAAEQEAHDRFGMTDPAMIHEYAYRQSSLVPNERPRPKEETVEESHQKEEVAKEVEDAAASRRNRDAKRKFLERKSDRPNAPRQAVSAAAGEAEGGTMGGSSFLEMALRDPDNAEILGADYKG